MSTSTVDFKLQELERNVSRCRDALEQFDEMQAEAGPTACTDKSRKHRQRLEAALWQALLKLNAAQKGQAGS